MYAKNDGFGDETLRAAWQELAAEAARQAARDMPWLLKLLARRGAVLAARYAFWKARLERLRPGQRRALQRRLGASLAGAALLLALAAAPGAAAPGATITVDQTSGAIAVDGACSLPEAIDNANGDSQYSAAAGECAAGSGADTIYLDTNVTLTASNNSTFGPTGLPVVTSAITIQGGGFTVSRSSASDFRILAVDSGGNLTLNSATVSGGVATGSFPANRGGGVFVTAALLTVTNSTFSGNSAYSGGGFGARSSTVAVANSTLSGNLAGRAGAGIEAAFGTLAVTNSTLSSNTASIYGGGIAVSGNRLLVSDSTLSGNSADVGGGIRPDNSTVTVTNSTLSGNLAALGGGIALRDATVTVTNSTLSGNSASFGGGIGISSGTATVTNSIVAMQSSGPDCSNLGTLASAGFNIESATTCGFAATGDQPSTNPLLGPLANNGGPTLTHLPQKNSLALDQGSCFAGTDQRGLARPVDLSDAFYPNGGGNACDVGAVEVQSITANAVKLQGFTAERAPGGGLAALWAAALAGLGGLGLSAFFARRRSWRRPGSGPTPAAPSSPPQAGDAASPSSYTLPAISSRGQIKHFAGSPLVVDPLALPEP